jgi:heme-degrading monooxygenase HmoA
MTVAAVVRVPNLSAEAYDASAQQLGPLVKQQPGFISHAAIQDGNDFVITEYWESEEQATRWYDSTVRPATAQAGISNFVAEFRQIHNLIQGEAG